MPFENELEEIKGLETFLDDIETIELENGAKAYILNTPKLKDIQACISLNRGSLDEPIGKYGYQHILEHVLFFGKTLSYNVNELKKLAKKFNLNPFVTFSKTSFEGEFPAKEVDAYLNAVSEMIFEPGFKERKNIGYYAKFVKGEVEKIHSFWSKLGVGDLDLANYRTALFGNTRYAAHQVGDLETVKHIGIKELIEYYDETKAASASAVEIILVGNLPKNAKEKIKMAFETKPEGISAIERPTITMPKIEKPVLIEHGTNSHTMFEYYLGWKMPEIFHQDYYPAMALMSLFETEFLSKICQKYDVFLTVDYDAKLGYAEIRGLLPHRKRERVMNDIFDSFEELKSGYVTGDKLEELTKSTIDSFKQKLSDPKERIDLVRSYINTGRTTYSHCSSFADNTPKKVTDFAKNWLPSKEVGYAQIIRPAKKL